VETAKKFGGYAAGVVFFRWPNEDETLAMPPEEALGVPLKPAELETKSEECVAVNCSDLYLLRASRFAANEVEYRIQVSADIDYMVPADNLPVRVVNPRELAVKIPPYGAKPRLHLGRVVTSKPVTFTLEAR
jgi:hypothetical protein